MQQVSGPGGMRVTGDVVNRLTEAQGNYDWGVIRAAQMAVTMGAMLARAGAAGWGARTEARKAFLLFDEGSFDRGELGFGLAERPLLPETPAERVANARLVEGLQTPTGMGLAGLTRGQVFGTGADGAPLGPVDSPGLLAEQEEALRRRSTGAGLGFNAGF
jgi:hypothetical protein